MTNINISRLDAGGNRVVSSTLMNIDEEGLYSVSISNGALPKVYTGRQFLDLLSSDIKLEAEDAKPVKKEAKAEPIVLDAKKNDVSEDLTSFSEEGLGPKHGSE